MRYQFVDCRQHLLRNVREVRAGTAGLVRSVVEGEAKEPGAWMPEQVIEPARFFAYLSSHGFRVAVGKADLGASARATSQSAAS